MALDKAALQNGIKALNDELYANVAGLTPAQASDRHATQMAQLIYDFVKTGDGVYQVGRLTAGATLVTAVSSPAIKIV